MSKGIYKSILKSKADSKKQFAILIDPDKFDNTDLIDLAETANVDFIMIGGSLIINNNFENCIQTIKKKNNYSNHYFSR